MPLTPRTVSFTTDFAPEQRRIDDNRRLAEQLQRESAQPLATGITAPGGYFVPTNPLQHLAHALKGVNARVYREQADEQDRSVSARRNEAMSAALRNMPQARTVTEDTSGEGTGSFDMSGSAGPQTASVRPGMAENAAWMGQLAQVSPQAVQMGSTLLGMQQRADEAGENRAFRAEESAANRAHQLQSRQLQIDAMSQNASLNREQQMALARERADNARQLAEMQIQSRLDAMRFAAGNRQPQAPVAVIGDDGKPVLVRPDQAVGRQPYNARADQANAAKLPTSALRMQQEELDAIQSASAIKNDLAAIQDQIKKGQLPLGPVRNLQSRAQNLAGMSDPASQNFAAFQATLERMRNESLRLNKGVQTEGDSQRAWNELVSNINDPKVVERQLKRIQEINERAVNQRRMNVDVIRNNFGVPAMDVSGATNQPAAIGAAPDEPPQGAVRRVR